MKTDSKEIRTLQEAIVFFSDPDRCREYFVARRWPEGVSCPRCGSVNVKFQPKYNRWQCSSHHELRQFTCKTGTIFEESPISLEKWMMATWMIANCKNGVSSYEIHRAIGVTQKTAWFMLHRIRLAMKNGSIEKLGQSGPVESDETFIGPNRRKMHAKKRAKLEAIASMEGEKFRTIGKTVVMGMLDRNLRQVRAFVIPDIKRATLQEKVLNNIKGGAEVMTDDFPGYRYALADKFVHQIIDHSRGYVDGKVHTNGIENCWSLLKRGLRGTYVAVEPFHLEKYIDEQIFRFNNRGSKDVPVNDGQRFDTLLSQVTGRRIMYKELTGKVGAAESF